MQGVLEEAGVPAADLAPLLAALAAQEVGVGELAGLEQDTLKSEFGVAQVKNILGSLPVCGFLK